jgi:hypothetical protein
MTKSDGDRKPSKLGWPERPNYGSWTLVRHVKHNAAGWPLPPSVRRLSADQLLPHLERRCCRPRDAGLLPSCLLKSRMSNSCAWLSQTSGFGLGLLEDGDVGIGLLPQSEKIPIGCTRVGRVARKRPAKAQMRPGKDHLVQGDAGWSRMFLDSVDVGRTS